MYIITKNEENKWCVLFNSDFGSFTDIEYLAKSMKMKGVKPEEISNPATFENNGVKYEEIDG